MWPTIIFSAMYNSQHISLGQRGEEVALKYLSDKGYVLRHKNWHNHHREIDIVAEWHGEIVFVEVKTRSEESDQFRSALSAVDLHKRNLLILAARNYMNYYYSGQMRPYRFDIITIVGNRLTHYKRAFTADTYSNRHSVGMEQEW